MTKFFWIHNDIENEDGFIEVNRKEAFKLIKLNYGTIISSNFDSDGENLYTGYGDMSKNYQYTGNVNTSLLSKIYLRL
jgi:hypothetical protein